MQFGCSKDYECAIMHDMKVRDARVMVGTSSHTWCLRNPSRGLCRLSRVSYIQNMHGQQVRDTRVLVGTSSHTWCLREPSRGSCRLSRVSCTHDWHAWMVPRDRVMVGLSSHTWCARFSSLEECALRGVKCIPCVRDHMIHVIIVVPICNVIAYFAH